MILTVTPNPAIDITYRIAGLRPGATNRVELVGRRFGGKGINVARVLHRAGDEVYALCPLGEDADEALSELARAGIPAGMVAVAGRARLCLIIEDTATGLTTTLNEPGTHAGAGFSDRLRRAVVARLHPGDVLVCSGSLPPFAEPDLVARLVTAAHERGCAALVDVTGEPLRRAAAAGAELLKPNRAELAATCPDADGPLAGARELLRLGAQRVIVSLGAAGMLLVDADEALHAYLPRSIAGNPTGAGDALVAAVAHNIVCGVGDDRVALARAAVAWSAAAVTCPQAGEISADWADLVPEVRVGPADDYEESP